MRNFNTNVEPVAKRGDCSLPPGTYLVVVQAFGEPFKGKAATGKSWLPVLTEAIAEGTNPISPCQGPSILFEYSDEDGFSSGFTGRGKWHDFLAAVGLLNNGTVNETDLYDCALNVECELFNERLSVKTMGEITPEQLPMVRAYLKEKR